MENKNKITRTRWLIYPQFQLRLILAGLIPFAASFLIFAWYVNTSLNHMTVAASVFGLPATDRYYDMLYLQKISLMKFLMLSGGLGLLASFVFILGVSHRLAGPIYRLKKHFVESVRSGTFREIQFRNGDYLKDIEADLNRVASGKFRSSQ